MDSNLELRDRVLLTINDHYRTRSSVLVSTHIAERLGLELNDQNVMAVGTVLRSLLRNGALSGIDPKTPDESAPEIVVLGMTSRGEEMVESLTGSGMTAEFLLAEAKFIVDKKIDAIKSIESQASSELAVTGIGLALFFIFGTSEAQIAAGTLPLVIVGAANLIAAIVLDLLCMSLGRVDDLPQLDIYHRHLVIRDKSIKARVSLSLVESYLGFANDLKAVGRAKTTRKRAATIAVMLGVVILALNYGWAALHHDAPLASFRLSCQGVQSIRCEQLER